MGKDDYVRSDESLGCAESTLFVSFLDGGKWAEFQVNFAESNAVG